MLVAFLVGGVAACGGPQSTLAPAGPAAESIARIWWLMFWGACAVWLLVMVLLVLPLRRGHRRRLPKPRLFIIGGGVILPVVVLAALLVHGSLSSASITGSRAEVEHRVQVTGRQWQWQFDYLGEDGEVLASSTDVLYMPLGRMVEFAVGSEDVIHSFWIPRLGGKMDAIPGRTNLIRLQADRAVPLRGQCAEFCGLNHAIMAFDVQVVAPADYAAWAASGGRGRPAGASP